MSAFLLPKQLSRLIRLLILLALLLVAACGGGSKGTGGTSIRVFQGKLLQDQAALKAASPLQGVTVIIAETGDFDVTDAQGAYEISTLTNSTSVRYIFIGEGVDAEFTLDSVDPGAKSVTVDFNVAGDGKSVAPARIDLSEDPKDDLNDDGEDPDGGPPIGDDDDDGQGSKEKVTICHLGKQTVEVSVSGLEAHIKHGDTIGECPDPSPKPPKADKKSVND